MRERKWPMIEQLIDMMLELDDKHWQTFISALSAAHEASQEDRSSSALWYHPMT